VILIAFDVYVVNENGCTWINPSCFWYCLGDNPNLPIINLWLLYSASIKILSNSPRYLGLDKYSLNDVYYVNVYAYSTLGLVRIRRINLYPLILNILPVLIVKQNLTDTIKLFFAITVHAV